MKASRQDLLAAGWAEEKVENMTRQQRRGTLHVKRNSRTKTGTPAHFKAWQAEGKIKSILQRMSLGALADSLGDSDHKAASAFAILAVNSRFKNVWNLCQATQSDVLAVKGIGPVSAEHIETYLKGRNVPLNWTVSA